VLTTVGRGSTIGGSGATTTVSGGRGAGAAMPAGSGVGGATATGAATGVSTTGVAGGAHATSHTHRTLAMILIMGGRNTAAIPNCASRINLPWVAVRDGRCFGRPD
jgi:hypothetical protein